jgi:hypothetical protein
MQIRGKNMQFPGFETLKTVIFRYATFFSGRRKYLFDLYIDFKQLFSFLLP